MAARHTAGVCNAAYGLVGGSLQKAQDPKAQAAGIVTQAAGPLACAAQEYIAGKYWDGSKWVVKNTAKVVSAGAGKVKDAGESVWNATLGRIF